MSYAMIIINKNMEKSKIMLHGHGQICSLHKDKRHLWRY